MKLTTHDLVILAIVMKDFTGSFAFLKHDHRGKFRLECINLYGRILKERDRVTIREFNKTCDENNKTEWKIKRKK
jgi:hypothetical protein